MVIDEDDDDDDDRNETVELIGRNRPKRDRGGWDIRHLKISI